MSLKSNNNNNKNIEIIYECNSLDEFGKKLRIIHFNDVYNVESSEQEPVGGAGRFLTAIEEVMRQGPTIILFPAMQ